LVHPPLVFFFTPNETKPRTPLKETKYLPDSSSPRPPIDVPLIPPRFAFFYLLSQASNVASCPPRTRTSSPPPDHVSATPLRLRGPTLSPSHSPKNAPPWGRNMELTLARAFLDFPRCSAPPPFFPLLPGLRLNHLSQEA